MFLFLIGAFAAAILSVYAIAYWAIRLVVELLVEIGRAIARARRAR